MSKEARCISDQAVEAFSKLLRKVFGKRKLEANDETSRKVTKQQTIVGLTFDGPGLPIKQTITAVDSNQAEQDSDSESISLISKLGRELTISCLLHLSRSEYGNIALLNKSFHSLIRSGFIYKLRRTIGFIEYWVYFSCNPFQWEAFDPVNGRWMHLPRLKASQCFICADKESLAIGTELLVFGRNIDDQIIYKYSLFTNSWTTATKMNTPRFLFASGSMGEIGILAGGVDSKGQILSSAELYNSETGTWVQIANMHKPRKMCSGFFMDEKFYVIGGIESYNRRLLTCGEMYDLKSKKWTLIPDMLPPRFERNAFELSQAPPLVAVANNQLYAADHELMALKKYDKERNEWVTLGGLPAHASSLNGWGIAFRACGDRLVVVGGPRSVGEGVLDINSWVPNDGPPQWNLLARKSIGSFVYNCTVMGC